MDTHARRGRLLDRGRYAQKKGEYGSGIGRCTTPPTLPAPLAGLRRPGAPVPADGQLRHTQLLGDRQPADADRWTAAPAERTDRWPHPLRSYLEKPAQHPGPATPTALPLKAELPPPLAAQRGVMDPPYEIKTDYARACRRAARRSRSAGLRDPLIWYRNWPCWNRRSWPSASKAAADAAARDWLHVRLTVTQY